MTSDTCERTLSAAADAFPPKIRLALVEDNPDNRILATAILSERHEIDAYEDGPSALAGIMANPPALVLLDLSLPGMDGLEILARLRADSRFHDLPIIALTAHSMAGDRDRLLAAGFDDYVTKPIEDEEILFGAIRRLLDNGA